MNVVITTVSCDYTLWYRKMGHAHQHVIKNLADNTEGGPDTVTATTLLVYIPYLVKTYPNVLYFTSHIRHAFLSRYPSD